MQNLNTSFQSFATTQKYMAVISNTALIGKEVTVKDESGNSFTGTIEAMGFDSTIEPYIKVVDSDGKSVVTGTSSIISINNKSSSSSTTKSST